MKKLTIIFCFFCHIANAQLVINSDNYHELESANEDMILIFDMPDLYTHNIKVGLSGIKVSAVQLEFNEKDSLFNTKQARSYITSFSKELSQMTIGKLNYSTIDSVMLDLINSNLFKSNPRFKINELEMSYYNGGKFRSLPKSLINYKTIESLTLSGDISNTPEFINAFSSLEFLTINTSSTKGIDFSTKKNVLVSIPSLTALDINIPNTVLDFTNMQKIRFLSLSRNLIVRISELSVLDSLTSLTILDTNNLRNQEVEKWETDLPTNLWTIYYEGDDLEWIVRVASKCNNLKYLTVRYRGVLDSSNYMSKKLSTDTGFEIRSLVYLEFVGYGVTHLPDNLLSKMPNVKYISLFMRIRGESYLPEDLSECQKLEVLGYHGDSIITLGGLVETPLKKLSLNSSAYMDSSIVCQISKIKTLEEVDIYVDDIDILFNCEFSSKNIKKVDVYSTDEMLLSAEDELHTKFPDAVVKIHFKGKRTMNRY